MKISSSAVSLNVEDVAASSAFLVEHFGFQQDMAADGFASLSRPDACVTEYGAAPLGSAHGAVPAPAAGGMG